MIQNSVHYKGLIVISVAENVSRALSLQLLIINLWQTHQRENWKIKSRCFCVYTEIVLNRLHNFLLHNYCATITIYLQSNHLRNNIKDDYRRETYQYFLSLLVLGHMWNIYHSIYLPLLLQNVERISMFINDVNSAHKT